MSVAEAAEAVSATAAVSAAEVVSAVEAAAAESALHHARWTNYKLTTDDPGTNHGQIMNQRRTSQERTTDES